MAGWIKVEKDRLNDPRLIRAAEHLSLDYELCWSAPDRNTPAPPCDNVTALHFMCNALRGALVTLWAYADVHIRDDDTLSLSAYSIDAMVHIEGFCSMLPRAWLIDNDDGTITLPGYCEHNALKTKRRAAVKSNARVSAFRAKNHQHGNAPSNAVTRQDVTPNVTRYNGVTKMVDQDLDLDLKKKKIDKRKTATRLPDDWQPGTAEIDYALSLKLNPTRTAEDFRDYWHAAAGERARKMDWLATWRTWCKRSNERVTTQPPRYNGNAQAFIPSPNSVSRGTPEWLKAIEHGRECGFRPPNPVETPTSYTLAVDMGRITKGKGPGLAGILKAVPH